MPSSLTDRQKIDYAKSVLRRTYTVDNLDDLKTYANTVFASATGSSITLTSTGFEGGHQAGQITFEKSILGIAIEELIAELDPDWAPPMRSRVICPDWRFSSPT